MRSPRFLLGQLVHPQVPTLCRLIARGFHRLWLPESKVHRRSEYFLQVVSLNPSDLCRLSKTRSKRPIPDGWATSEAIQEYKPAQSTESLYPGGKSLALDPTGDLVLVGGVDGVAGVYSLSKQQVVQTLKAGGPVTDAVWAGNKAIVASATGAVKVFENGTEIANFTSHAGEVTALAVHPSGDIIGSVGVDKSYVLYDLTTSSPITQIFSDSGKSPSLALL